MKKKIVVGTEEVVDSENIVINEELMDSETN